MLSEMIIKLVKIWQWNRKWESNTYSSGCRRSVTKCYETLARASWTEIWHNIFWWCYWRESDIPW